MHWAHAMPAPARTTPSASAQFVRYVCTARGAATLAVALFATIVVWNLADAARVSVTRDDPRAAFAAAMARYVPSTLPPCGEAVEDVPCTRFTQPAHSAATAEARCLSYLLLRPAHARGGRYFAQLLVSLASVRRHYFAALNVSYPVIVFYNAAAPPSDAERADMAAALGTEPLLEAVDFEALARDYEATHGHALPPYTPCRSRQPFVRRALFTRDYMLMNVWRLYGLWPRLRALGARYTLMLDSDLRLARPLAPTEDALAWSALSAPEPLVYGYSHVDTDPPLCYQGDETLHFARCVESRAATLGTLSDCGASQGVAPLRVPLATLERGLAAATVFHGAAQLASVDFFVSPHYRAYAAYVGRLGGLPQKRWSDQSTFWPALAMFAPPGAVRPLALARATVHAHVEAPPAGAAS